MTSSMSKREERRGSFQTPLNTELPCRVLVVDDDPVCQKLVEEMLRQCHYEGMWDWILSSGRTLSSAPFCHKRQAATGSC